MKFEAFDFTKEVLSGVQAAQYTECMPVQEKVFQHSLSGKDVSVQSQTGSGKTAAFLLTIFNEFVLKRDEKRVKAIIIVPTRELAVQIETDAKLLSSGIPDITIGCFYGGVGYQKQESLIKNNVDIIIGTPGRLIDFSKSGKIDFKSFDITVVDEADRLFDMGFYPDIRLMLNRMRPREKRQTMLFSATLNARARNLSWDFMNHPVEIEIEPENVTVEEIHQELYHISKNEKSTLLLFLLEKYKPENAIIFTNKKVRAVEVAKRLRLNGFNVQYLMGDLPQKKRLKVIDRMKAGEIKFLVATDVAARGLHVDDLKMVINYDIPEDYENYVHRIGRTARAGKSGIAITMACEEYVYGLEPIHDYIGMKIPVVWVEDDELAAIEDKSASIRTRELVKDAEGYRSSNRGSGSNRGSSSSRGGRSGNRNSHSSRNNRSGGTHSGHKTSHDAGKPGQRSGSHARKRPGSDGHTHKPGSDGGHRSDTSHAAKKGGSHSQKQNSRKSPANQRPPKNGQVDYGAIGSLSLEERMAIYKKQMMSESTQDKAGQSTRKQQSTASHSGKRSGRSGEQQTGGQQTGGKQKQGQKKTPEMNRPKNSASGKKPVERESAEKKSSGFFNKLFNRRSSKDS